MNQVRLSDEIEGHLLKIVKRSLHAITRLEQYLKNSKLHSYLAFVISLFH